MSDRVSVDKCSGPRCACRHRAPRPPMPVEEQWCCPSRSTGTENAPAAPAGCTAITFLSTATAGSAPTRRTH